MHLLSSFRIESGSKKDLQIAQSEAILNSDLGIDTSNIDDSIYSSTQSMATVFSNSILDNMSVKHPDIFLKFELEIPAELNGGKFFTFSFSPSEIDGTLFWNTVLSENCPNFVSEFKKDIKSVHRIKPNTFINAMINAGCNFSYCVYRQDSE